MLLCFDPGETRKAPGVGWASFDLPSGDMVDFGQILNEDLVDLLRTIQPTLVICENYKNRPWKRGASNFSENKTSQVIGAIRMWCELYDVPMVMQEPDNKDMGIMWSGTRVPKNHALSHQVDAYGHGVFYIVKNGIKPVSAYHKREVKI